VNKYKILGQDFQINLGVLKIILFSKLFKSIQTTCVLQEVYFSKKNFNLESAPKTH